jgi:hypothetical protein
MAKQEQTSNSELKLVLPPAVPLLYKGKSFITFEMMDAFHRCSQGNSQRAFHRHRNQLIPGEDFVEVPAKEFNRLIGEQKANSKADSASALTPSKADFESALACKGDSESPLTHARGRDRVLLFEGGYLMLSKPMGDDEAWRVQRALVRSYFHSKAPASPALSSTTLSTSDVERIAEVVAPRVAEIILPEVLGAISQLSRRLDEVESSMSRRLDEVEKRLWHDAINGRHNIRQFIERQMSKPQSSGDGPAPLRSQALQINASVSPSSRAAALEAWARLIAAWWNLFGGKLRRASEIAPLAEADLLDADSSNGRSKQFARMAERCEGALYSVQDGALKVRLRRGERKAGSPMLYCLEPEL